jgi:hypothetical protein
MVSVEKERAVLRISHSISSNKTLMERHASGLSFVGRISERMTSAERAERNVGAANHTGELEKR